MIIRILLWTFLFLLFVTIQHALGEYYLIIKKGYRRFGYRIFLLMQCCSIILGSCLMGFDEHLYFLGLTFLLITFYLSIKFQNRYDRRNNEEAEKTSRSQ